MENHNFKLKFNLRDMLRRKGIRRSWALHFRSEMQAGGERIWPIFLLTVFGGSYQLAGGVTAATTSISLLLLYTIGKYLDSGNRQTILKRGAMLYSLSWVGRFIFVTPTVLPVADTFGKFSSLARDQAIETIDLDNITDGVSASMQDEFVTVREMGVDIAISLSLISHALIAHFFGIEAAFLFSATMGLLFLLDL